MYQQPNDDNGKSHTHKRIFQGPTRPEATKMTEQSNRILRDDEQTLRPKTFVVAVINHILILLQRSS